MDNFIPEFMEVLSPEGWIELKDYRQRTPLLVLNKSLKTTYLTPKLFSKYNYKGPLVEIETDSDIVYLKPSSKVLTIEGILKAKDLHKRNNLCRYFSGQTIEGVRTGIWEGMLFSLFFGEDMYLPIKFEKDYCLLIV